MRDAAWPFVGFAQPEAQGVEDVELLLEIDVSLEDLGGGELGNTGNGIE